MAVVRPLASAYNRWPAAATCTDINEIGFGVHRPAVMAEPVHESRHHSCLIAAHDATVDVIFKAG
jgi:hypothetical protein